MRFLPHWRKATWAVVIWTVLMAIWIIAGSQQTPDKTCAGETGSALDLCQSAYHLGTGIGVTLLFALWFIGFVILSLIWLMSRPDRRLCPVCGEQVKKGLTVCPKCGYNFAAAFSQTAATQVPQCWRCHAPIAVGQSPCPKCGAPIAWPTQQAPPPQA
jgi:RNA polymerase subunit RPABC4/transcription elongation factor Spt4